MRVLNKIIDRIILGLAVIAGIILLFLLLAVCFATVSRYLFNAPFAVLIDYSAYSLLYVAFFGAPWLMQQRGHVNIDLFMNMVKLGTRKKWSGVIHVILTAVSLILGYIGFVQTQTYFINSIVMQDQMRTPQWILLICIPIACAMLAIQCVRNARKDFADAKALCDGDESLIEKAEGV